MSEPKDWFVVQVRGNAIEAAEEINESVVTWEAYCPSFREKVKASRHVKSRREVERALYGQYLFVHDLNGGRFWDVVLRLRCVDGFLSIGGSPIPVRNAVVEHLRKLQEFGLFDSAEIEGSLRKGDLLRVKREGYENIRVTFEGLLGEDKAEVLITLFGRTNLTDVPLELLEKVFEKK